jgi:hypothetical protein
MLCNCYYTYHAYRAQGTLLTHLLQRSLEALKDLKLDLGLSNVGLAAASAGNLLCLGDLVPDSLCPCQSLFLQSRVMARTSALKSSNG